MFKRDYTYKTLDVASNNGQQEKNVFDFASDK